MPEEYQIYHNPRCSKSRQTLQILRDNGVEPTIIEYLKDTPTAKELKKILTKLHLKPKDILRTGEQIYKNQFKNMSFTDAEWIDIMVENPILIERPIVLKGNTGVIGRPPDNVIKLF
ncbi:arsenate reductase (glutaredoxin) [Cryomorpha ignava]|uniref:Arsenate reductase (Glutaredoxin) n=1 Tax=Cryomorpha ignava TaxID=101383 RepID=A0A7K3WRB4_9FLAO|nr:arsenate reductase (glutaredoxin) [Cryomorpha ignava]NEN23382.1 arsenate reductase (glutaredoxin) [Cryomorpha ignava]